MRRMSRPLTVSFTAIAATMALLALGLPSAGATGSDAALRLSSRAFAPAAVHLPPGWSLVGTKDGRARLSWRAPSPVRVTDAGLVFVDAGSALGSPRISADGQTLTLVLDSLPGADLSGLQVWQGTTRLDATRAVQPRQSTTPAPGVSPARWRQQTRLLADDPGVRGPYATTSRNYTLASLPIAGFPAPVEMLGRVVRPVGAPGARPLVVFLHGRHSTCYKGHRSSGDWPCRPSWSPIPSYLGYLETQRLLASQGYVTVSISANGINGQDYLLADGGAEARSLLVRQHLKDWAQWATTGGAPFGDHLVGAVDLSHVVLIGHSRGGEGVNRAAIDSVPANPWHIAGQVLIGPTDFGQQVASGVPTEVLLPYCDGDVSDLQGQQFVDRGRDITTDPALRSAVMVMGADHNFFNREWTPGVSQAPSWDDWGDPRDPTCGTHAPTRLTASQQRRVGAVYEAAGVHLFAAGDTGVLPLLDGSRARVASAKAAVVHSAALGANRTPVYLPESGGSATSTGSVVSDVCAGFQPKQTQSCAPRFSVPHFLSMWYSFRDPAPYAWRTSWTSSGGRATVSTGSADLSSSKQLELRLAEDPKQPLARFAIQVRDGNGHRFTWPASVVTALPGTTWVRKVWAQTVRVPVAAAAAAGVDVSQISSISLLPRSPTGRVWVLDAHGWRSGLAPVPAIHLPQVNVSNATVQEGNAGPHTEYVHVSLTGTIHTSAKFWVEASDSTGTNEPIDATVTLHPGDTGFDLPIPVSGNTVDDYDLNYQVLLKAISGVSTGNYLATFTVLDDDPSPTLTVTRSASTVEGSPLKWTFTLSEPSNVGLSMGFRAKPTRTPPELATDDVPARWLKHCGRVPAAPKPLSASGLWCLGINIDPGQTSATLRIPTVTDGITEGDEFVRLRQSWSSTDSTDPKIILHGTVMDS